MFATGTRQVIVLSGFLGSGKTTLLGKLIARYKEEGWKPAVIMNEIGETSLDSLLVEPGVPLNEIANGCICCSVRGELAVSIKLLLEEHDPDVIIIEATGLANPMEIMESITDASMIMRISLETLITVIDSKHLYDRLGKDNNRTFKLMEDQVRAADCVIMNKADLVTREELEAARDRINAWNNRATVLTSIGADIDLAQIPRSVASRTAPEDNAPHSETALSYDHVTVYTHYLTHPVEEERFERLIAELPREVYRAKGIVTIAGADSDGRRAFFQYAYREAQLMDIRPQGPVPDVLVFMGENISRSRLRMMVRYWLGSGPTITTLRIQPHRRKG